MSDRAPGPAVVVPEVMTAAPRVGPLPALEAPRPVVFTLQNALQVVAVRRTVAPVVAVSVAFRTGSDADPPGMAGLGAATADMLDEGAGDRDALALAEELEHLGADLWLGCGRDGSQLSVHTPTISFPAALKLAADVLLRPRLTAEDWGRVRGDRLTSVIQRRDQPESVAGVVGDLALYGEGHPYGLPIDGFEATVERIGVDDIRRFHDTYYRPNNGTVVVTGDFDEGMLRDQLESAFGSWTGAPLPAGKATPPLPQAPRLVLVDRPGAPQSVVRLLLPGVDRRSPDRPALSMMNAILGGSFTSRLNFNLREQKGYTYGAGSSFSFLRRPGAFSARAAVFSEVTDAAVGEFLHELAGLRTHPITDDERTKARAMLLDRVAEGLASAGGIAATFGEIGLYGLALDEPQRFIAALERVSAADLDRLANAYVDPDRACIVVVGDRATVEPALRARGLPAPALRDADGNPA